MPYTNLQSKKEKKMPTDIKDLLLNLSEDPFRTEEFRKDPQRFLDREGFEKSSQQVVVTGDFAQIDLELTRKDKKPRMLIEDVAPRPDPFPPPPPERAGEPVNTVG